MRPGRAQGGMQARSSVKMRRASGRSRRGRHSPDEATRHRARKVVMLAVAVALAVCMPAYGAWRLFFAREADVGAGVPVQIEVPAGSDSADIAKLLAEAGVIDNAAMFRARARIDGIDAELRPGVYDLVTGMPYDEVVKCLLDGPSAGYIKVTIPEGFTAAKIANRLEAQAGIPAEEFLELAYGQAAMFADQHPYLQDAHEGSLEGYLFPKTYEIPARSSAADVIQMMLDQFDAEYARLDAKAKADSGLSVHEVVTIASMIEREARLPEERALISSVIHNRLAKGMKLEIDATVEYVIQENRPRLLKSDLAVDSPYNTYKHHGLPPGPISNPGLASIEAAILPAKTSYLYYVRTGEDGSHTFCETYEEFLEAKERSKEEGR